jgi:hypothetical protein
MLTIREPQLRCFAASLRSERMAGMCAYLRAQFPEELQGEDDDTLHGRVEAALARAALFGLHTERDCCRYLNLAVLYGWDAGQRPEHAWMTAILTDPAVSDPSQRLHRLVLHCIRRSEVEDHNRQLRNRP